MSRSPDDDIAFIRALAEVLRDNDLGEIEVAREFGEDDELKVRLTRTPPPAPAPVMAAPVAPVAAAQAPAAPAPSPVAAAQTDDPADLPGAVTSPMVGTAYLSPEPGAASFVKVGDAVREGQTLLIIEAMKTMNQIAAHRDGVIRRILIEDKQPVEFGAPLMVIE